MNTEDFKLECAECYLTDECDAMYGGMNPPCTEVALRTAYDNTSSLKSICPNCTRQLSGHNFDEKCSIWRRCVVIECDDFHGYSK